MSKATDLISLFEMKSYGGYGGWVSLRGEIFYLSRYQTHDSLANDIVSKKYPNEKLSLINNPYKILIYDKHWIRFVLESEGRWNLHTTLANKHNLKKVAEHLDIKTTDEIVVELDKPDGKTINKDIIGKELYDDNNW